MLELKELNARKWEYLPANKELRCVDSFEEISWPKYSGQDRYDNSIFNLEKGVTCTIQKSKSGEWYIASVKDIENRSYGYGNYVIRAFAKRDEQEEKKEKEKGNENYFVRFGRFDEWEKESTDNKWVRVRKDNWFTQA